VKLPRFHLATILLATLLLSAFIGLNLLGRPREIVHFTSLTDLFSRIRLIKPSYYSNHYRMTTFSVGWPADLTSFPRLIFSDEIDTFDYPTDAEWLELKRLATVPEPSDGVWESSTFQQLAPTIYKELRWIDGTLPDGPPARIQFLSLDRLEDYGWNTQNIAINAAVALAITLALAAACELFLRRKKKTSPDPGGVRTS